MVKYTVKYSNTLTKIDLKESMIVYFWKNDRTHSKSRKLFFPLRILGIQPNYPIMVLKTFQINNPFALSTHCSLKLHPYIICKNSADHPVSWESTLRIGVLLLYASEWGWTPPDCRKLYHQIYICTCTPCRAITKCAQGVQ